MCGWIIPFSVLIENVLYPAFQIPLQRKCDDMRKIRFAAVFILLSVLYCFFGISASTASNHQPAFQIDFIDVGQGDAALVQCDGHYMLVDGGSSKKSGLIYTCLKKRSITYLDYIVATHPDADHIGGLAGALNYAQAGTVFSPVTQSDTKTFQSFLKYLAKQGKVITIPKAGDTFSLGTASVTVVGPVKPGKESNNNSIVLRIVYGKTSFLLTGDAEISEEQDIIRFFPGIKSTVLKAAHHGSNYSTSYLFLRTVAPQYAVISVGAGNEYGHPAENTLSRLRDANVKTYRTDLQGDVICTSDGITVSFQTSKNQDADPLVGSGPGQNSNDPAAKSIPTTQESAQSRPQSSSAQTYILNTNTHKFHYPTCSSVNDMKEKNKKVFNGTRDEAIAQGYVPCKRCNP